MGHGKAFSAVCADGGIYGYLPRPDRIHPIGSYVQRDAGCNDDGDHVSMGLRATCWSSTGSSCFCNSTWVLF
eukprot:4076788-Pleurochrysis_carterae.AAC.1